ncbi:MAG: hypothetical protein GX442_04295 [Candidatus Riflebacteria bacterium]|nr:hypothetical protein [Candidatus Riflebacteria bacterium]
MPVNQQNLARFLIGLLVVASFAGILIGCKETNNALPVAVITSGEDFVQHSATIGSFTLKGNVFASPTSSLVGLGGMMVSLFEEGSRLKTTRTSSGEGLFVFYDVGASVYTIKVEDEAKKYASATAYVTVLGSGTTSPASIAIALDKLP